jgi:heptosyltransferase-3
MSELTKKIERRVKRAVLGRLMGGAPSRSIPSARLDLRGVRRVLLVRVNFRMGNLLLLTPALTALRQALPEARLDVLCVDAYAALLENNPDLDRVITMSRRTFWRPLALARVVHTLRRERYDLVVDCARGASFLGAFVVAVSGGQYRVGHTGSRYQRFFNVHVQRDGADLKHKIDVLCAFIAGLGIPPVSGDMKVVLSDAERAWAAAEWKALGLAAERPTIGVIIGARGRKRWPRERFLELVEQSHALGEPTVVLFAGPDDRAELQALASHLAHKAVVAPPLPVRRFAALLSRCTVVVTADTGPMHLAAAVGVPTVSVFHATQAIYYAPQGTLHRAVQATSGTADVSAVLAAVAETVAQFPGYATRGDQR